jgi:hypothetical protein
MQSKIPRPGKRPAQLTRKRLLALAAPFTKALAHLRFRFSSFADVCSVLATAFLEALSRSPAGPRCWPPLLRASASARCSVTVISLSLRPACSRCFSWWCSSASTIFVVCARSLLDGGCQPVDRAPNREQPIAMFDGSPSRSGSLGEISAVFKAPAIWVWSFSIMGLVPFRRFGFPIRTGDAVRSLADNGIWATCLADVY